MTANTLASYQPEDLGSDATAEDLADFKLAVRTAMKVKGMNEEDAIEYVWNDGDFCPRVAELID